MHLCQCFYYHQVKLNLVQVRLSIGLKIKPFIDGIVHMVTWIYVWYYTSPDGQAYSTITMMMFVDVITFNTCNACRDFL